MFHCFKIPYFTFTFFTKSTYNEYIGPYFLSHVVVLRFSPVNSPSSSLTLTTAVTPAAMSMPFIHDDVQRSLDRTFFTLTWFPCTGEQEHADESALCFAADAI
jgi:hypothetical protein